MSQNEEASRSRTQNQTQMRQKSQLASKQNTELKNPCMKEQQLSFKCLSTSNYDKEVCSSVFTNYKNCIEFWSKVKHDRRRKGLSPELPLPEQRQEIKEEYLRTGKF